MFARLLPLWLLLCAPAAAQDSVRGWYLSPEALASNSAGIVHVRIDHITTTQLANRVYTDVAGTVLDALRGQPGPTIAIRQPGGRHGNLVTWSGPMPAWSENEEWLFCLAYPESHGWWTVTGIKQGAFKVAGADAVRDFSGFTFIRPVPVSLEAGAIERLPLAELKARLAAAADSRWSPPSAATTVAATTNVVGVANQGGDRTAPALPQGSTCPPAQPTTDMTRCNPGCVRGATILVVLALLCGLLYRRFNQRKGKATP